MGRNKAKTLYWIWKKYRDLRWGEKLREVGVVTQEDVNGFLRLVGEREEEWDSWKLGGFVSKVLEICYKGKEIYLDVGLVDGEIDVGRELNWDGVVYVNGDVDGDVGYEMEKGTVVVEGDVKGSVGYLMESGVIVVKGDVGVGVGYVMGGGVIIVNGNVDGDVGCAMKDGVIYVDGKIHYDEWLAWVKKGFVVYKGFVYTGRWVE